MPDMPPVEAGAYLIEYLWEIGPTMAGGMGASAITHVEILAWAQLIGVALQPWEVRMLRRLSREFIAESHRAEKIGAQAPWEPNDAEPVDLGGVAKRMRERMRAMAAG